MSPKIGIVMGSESDLPVMQGAANIFAEFDIPFEMRVLSAHRTPDQTKEFATSARARGIKVLIAGAGGAAHLGGVLAAYTQLPVLGVPIPSNHLKGIDSLLSIVQMPSGVPVASLAIGGSKNAALLALQILALEDDELYRRLVEYREAMVERVEAMDQRVSSVAEAMSGHLAGTDADS
jgi:5-(carboxyamino)imidazole ribonucleotide mutase